jgi:hypothetical protein
LRRRTTVEAAQDANAEKCQRSACPYEARIAQLLIQESTLVDLGGRLNSLIAAVGGMQTEFGVLQALYRQHRDEEGKHAEQLERLCNEFGRLSARLEERERVTDRWSTFGRWLLPVLVSILALIIAYRK